VTFSEPELTKMYEIHLLIDTRGVVAVAAFTDKAVVDGYDECSCDDECEVCESLVPPRSDEWPNHGFYDETVFLYGPGSTHPSHDGRENTKINRVHVVSNGFGEFLWAFTDKRLAEETCTYPLEDKCPYCEFYESRGEMCPYKEVQIDTVELDSPSLIQHSKERIARFRRRLSGGERYRGDALKLGKEACGISSRHSQRPN
jgi:hypothetical protein